MIKAYSYIRMSSLEQMTGDSYRRQWAATRRYIEENELELVDSYDDIGVSAFRGKNSDFGGLSLFLAAVEDGRIPRGSHLIVESLDRLTRLNMFDALSLLNRIIQQDIIVVTLQDGQIYSKQNVAQNPASMMVAVVVLLRAHEESQTKSKRLTAVWAEKKNRARNGVVTGHRLPAWLTHSSDKSKINAGSDRIRTLRKVFEMSRDGWGAYSIARHLNETLEPSWGPKGAIWQESYIKKLLSNRAVLGEYQPHRKIEDGGRMVRVTEGPVIRDYYPAVISASLFQAAQEAMSARRVGGGGRKGKGFSNLFTGFLKCGLCGTGLRFIDKGPPPKGGTYLRCSKAVLKGGCDAPLWRYQIVEQSLLNVVENIDLEFVLGGSRIERKRNDKHEELLELNDEIARIVDREKNLVAAIELATTPLPALVDALAQCSTQKNEMHSRKGAVQSELADIGNINPREQKERIGKLLNAIRRDPVNEADEAARRLLSAELRRVLRTVRLKPIVHLTYEIESEQPKWYIELAPTRAELKRLCDDYSFEVVLVYRNGDVQIADPLANSVIAIRQSRKARLARQKREAEANINGKIRKLS